MKTYLQTLFLDDEGNESLFIIKGVRTDLTDFDVNDCLDDILYTNCLYINDSFPTTKVSSHLYEEIVTITEFDE